MKIILMLMSAVPLVTLATLAPSTTSTATTKAKSVKCGCTLAEQNEYVAAQERVSNIQPLVKACIDKADLDLLCQQGPTTMETWCASGGIFQTCETDTDKDGDGIVGEPHFMQKRYLIKYTCTTGTFYVCGNWMPMKDNSGGSNQDVCCSTSTAPPACPPNSVPVECPK
ncbi:MAG: hypothetical protein CBB60_006855 [Armatimonadetes bacterium Cent15-Ar3]|nr:MAG: hypothetical protein CBB60_006855 [Armatimonadetes bacterium Cent15-Ar3]